MLVKMQRKVNPKPRERNTEGVLRVLETKLSELTNQLSTLTCVKHYNRYNCMHGRFLGKFETQSNWLVQVLFIP